MDYVIASEVPGRLRVRLVGPVPADDLDALYRVLGACPAVERANVYPRIGSIAVRYRAADGARQRVLDHLDAIDAEAIGKMKGSVRIINLARNGLVDEGEPGIPGITVQLLQDGEAVYETVTDAYGYYLFTDVYPGAYTLVAKAYPELTPTSQVEALRIISSCLVGGDGNEAHSDPFEVESGSLNVNYDLGYLLREGESLPSAITAPPTRDWTLSNTK